MAGGGRPASPLTTVPWLASACAGLRCEASGEPTEKWETESTFSPSTLSSWPPILEAFTRRSWSAWPQSSAGHAPTLPAQDASVFPVGLAQAGPGGSWWPSVHRPDPSNPLGLPGYCSGVGDSPGLQVLHQGQPVLPLTPGGAPSVRPAWCVPPSSPAEQLRSPARTVGAL